jgi:hypothetical protein
MPLPLAGARIKAADLAAIFPLGVDAWMPYTPTVSQGATTDIAKTVTYSAYFKEGRKVTWEFYLTVTGTGTAAAGVGVTLPVLAATNATVAGVIFLYDASSLTGYVAAAIPASTSVVSGWISGGTNTAGSTGGVFTAAIANGDQIRGQIIYEAAA